MGEKTKIEWADSTFNPWIGCEKVSAGCAHCYAEALMDTRFGRVEWGASGTRKRTSVAYWKKPIAWNKKAGLSGTRQRVFCASLADVFEDRPELAEWRVDLFRLIDATPNLDWMLLTKRPEAVRDLLADVGRHFGPMSFMGGGLLPENVWLGTSVENEEMAQERIPELLRVPSFVKFLSMEPLLGRVDLAHVQESILAGSIIQKMVDWIIVGGETGRNARPMIAPWVRQVRNFCVANDTPFFFKAWGGEPGRQTGRDLDGRTWSELPTPSKLWWSNG